VIAQPLWRRSGETVAPFRNRFNELTVGQRFAQGFTQSRDVLGKIRFFDKGVRPDLLQQVLLRQQPSLAVQEYEQQIERLGRQRHAGFVAEKLAFFRKWLNPPNIKLMVAAAEAEAEKRNVHVTRTHFIPGADANNPILQMRTWERHDVGTTPGFGGDVERALRSIKVPLLYMPSETDLYFPIGDARYEAAFISGVSLTPIPSLWGHTAGAASNPADAKFLNETIGRFLSGKTL
jgi:homoserine acetyltransferase